METSFASQHRSVPWGFRGSCSPFHGIRMDAKWERARVRCKKPRRQQIAIGEFPREPAPGSG